MVGGAVAAGCSVSRSWTSVRSGVTTGHADHPGRSRVHDTTKVRNKVTEEVVADPTLLATAGAPARCEVDMSAFGACDFLGNRKLRNGLDLAD